MPSTLQLVIDLLQLGPHPFRLGLAPNPEPPLPPGRTDVRETQEGERLRLAQPPRPTTFGRVASEFDQPCLVRVKLQTELGEPVAKRGEEPVGVVTMLKPRRVHRPHPAPQRTPTRDLSFPGRGLRRRQTADAVLTRL